MASRDRHDPLLVDPCLEVWRRPVGVDAAELSAISSEIYREALANRPAPETPSPRDFALWQAGRWARRILLMDRSAIGREER